MMCKTWLTIFTIKLALCASLSAEESAENDKNFLLNQDKTLLESSLPIEALYSLNEGQMFKEVTQEVLRSDDTPQESKEAIQHYGRRIIVFKYPSDHLWIKGFISFTPNPEHHPLLILYRWGNNNFALMNPGVIFATYKNYTVISSTLRGGVSEGTDEFGGKDVDDMKNLIEYIPTIAKEIGFSIHPSCVFMLGPSRGSLEMFLTLSHFPGLQKKVNKVVALSGILDLKELIHDRPFDMKLMFEHVYGMPTETDKEENWIAQRDPLKTVSKISTSLPILIIQGKEDKRIALSEGEHMMQTLKKSGHNVDYWVFPKGEHVYMNDPLLMQKIAKWLETNTPCEKIAINQ